MRKGSIFYCCLLLSYWLYGQSPLDTTMLELKRVVKGKITPKSVVYAGKGLFFAQNMVYKHSVTVYDSLGNLITTIKDEVNLEDCKGEPYKGSYKGGPVEAVAVQEGNYVWVSNYQMYGEGFDNPGCDACAIGDHYDPSFLYKINTETFEIDAIVKVGCVPKYLAAVQHDKYVLVSNWSSGDVSVVNNYTFEEERKIKVGRYPRGIVEDTIRDKAYVAIMGASDIVSIDLKTWETDTIKNVGRAPRHLSICEDYLFISLNNLGQILRLNLINGERKYINTGKAPRSMVLSDDGAYLYVGNYSSNTLSKVRTSDMTVVQQVATNSKPIGVAFDPVNKNVWVACYSGSLMLFEERATERRETCPCHIIVASFSTKKRAKDYVKTLKNKGYKASVVKSSNGYYRVSTGTYKEKQDAMNDLNNYQEKIESEAYIMFSD